MYLGFAINSVNIRFFLGHSLHHEHKVFNALIWLRLHDPTSKGINALKLVRASHVAFHLWRQILVWENCVVAELATPWLASFLLSMHALHVIVQNVHI